MKENINKKIWKSKGVFKLNKMNKDNININIWSSINIDTLFIT